MNISFDFSSDFQMVKRKMERKREEKMRSKGKRWEEENLNGVGRVILACQQHSEIRKGTFML